jgi:hypothetical protein
MHAVDDRPAFIVHGWKHVAAVLEIARQQRRAVLLVTPVGASYSSGVGFWSAIQARIAALYADIDVRLAVDCDDAPGHVLAALRVGLKWLVFRGNDAARRRLLDIAGQSGAEMIAPPDDALDLLGIARPQADITARLAPT